MQKEGKIVEKKDKKTQVATRASPHRAPLAGAASRRSQLSTTR